MEINKEAAKYFFVLLRGERGKRALDYFKKRALSDETIHKFGLGYSDQYSDDLYRYLRSKGYDDEILKDSDLSRSMRCGADMISSGTVPCFRSWMCTIR